MSGCSAVSALAETHRAERALKSTEGLRPTPTATYELTMSRAYLEKAREEAAEAHYGSAVLYAQASTRAAQEAQRTQVAHLFPTPVPLRRQVEAREQNDADAHEAPHKVEDSQ